MESSHRKFRGKDSDTREDKDGWTNASARQRETANGSSILEGMMDKIREAALSKNEGITVDPDDGLVIMFWKGTSYSDCVD